MKFIRYFFVGGTAALVDIGLFYLGAVIFHANYLLVGTFSFILATLVNYILSIWLVFESGVRFSRRNEVALVFLASAVGLGINQLVLYLCVSRLAVDVMIGKLAATGSVFLWNYFMRSRYIFSGPALSKET